MARAVLTNFRAEDFENLKSGGAAKSAPAAAATPEPAPAPAPAPEPADEPKDDSGVPEGSRAEINKWVGDDKDRARQALEAENRRDNPRKTVIADLEEKLENDDSK